MSRMKIILAVTVLFYLGGIRQGFGDSGSFSLEERIRVLEEKLSQTDILNEKVKKLESENEMLNQKIIRLEAQATVQPEAAKTPSLETPKPEVALLEKIGTKLKIKGRAGAGFFKSGDRGTFPQGSFEVPEAKMQFSYAPDDFNTIVLRMNLNNAVFNSVDYFYFESKDFLPMLKDSPYTLESKIGRFKIPYGEETWSNNLVERALLSNSASDISGNDEGVLLSGKVGKAKPLKWAFAVTNGSTGTGSDNVDAKSFTGKLDYSIWDDLLFSASAHHSGSLKSAAGEMSFAGNTARPAGALNWDRTMWELDLRYDYRKGKVLNPPAYTDSKAYVRGAFGQVIDDGTVASDVEANYGYVEGLYNFTPKVYSALRYSFIDTRHGVLTVLNGIRDASHYDRYSIALGYRWTANTILKIGYDWNEASALLGDPADDLFSAAIVSSF